jgi:hypothetical protein
MKNLKVTFLSALALIAFTASLRAEFLYVANFGSYNISAYQIGKNGSLTPVPGSLFSAGIAPFSVTISPQFQKE